MIGFAHTPDGRRLEVSRPVAASRDRVWEVLTDTRRWPEWGPSVRAVESPTRYVHAGTAGRVRTVGGARLPFEVTTCGDYRWTWEVAGVPATGHRVDAGARPRVVFEVPVLAAWYAPVCRRACRRIARLVEGS